MPAHPHYLAGGGKGEFILGYGELTEASIVEGIRRLADVLNN
jgi:DNA-binding transcriptional MocR family regulator